jgi:hypothetical protein
MVLSASIFSQLLTVFPRVEFAKLVKNRQAEKAAKGFTCWEQFVAMLFCQLGPVDSLRDISLGLAGFHGKLAHLGVSKAPPKSTLSYANTHRPWELFSDLFHSSLDFCRGVAPRKNFRFKNKLLSLDASTIDLCLALFPWAKFRRTKGAVKLHVLLDHDGYLPVFADITDGKTHEVRVAQRLRFPEDSIVAMDKGYNDYALFGRFCDEGVWFVTRLKDNASCTDVEPREVPAGGKILSDKEIVLDGVGAVEKCPHFLRRVVVWDEENEREIVLLTNQMKFAASTIAAIYKERWQIELFFKALKQNLRIKTFVGTTENALKIQIWTALIAILLIKFIKFRSTFGWSLSSLAAMLRLNLFTYRPLWEWANHPRLEPPDDPVYEQLDLFQPCLGQHP